MWRRWWGIWWGFFGGGNGRESDKNNHIKPMKIVFVLTQSLDSPSGLGRYGPLARELVKLGHQVEIIALHYAWHQLQEKQYIDAGVYINYVGQMHVRKEGPRKIYFSPIRLIWVSLLAIIRLALAIARSNAELIHLGKPQPFNVLAVKISRKGRKVYCDCDDYEAETNKFSNGWQRQIVQYFEDNIIYNVSGLTVNTKFTQQRYIQLGYPEKQIRYVPNGIERSRFISPPTVKYLRKQWSINSDAPIIIYVGTLGLLSHPVDLLLKAFQKVIQHLPKARLMLVGGGEDYDTLQKLAEYLDITDKTIFTGRIHPNKVPGYLALATISVDPVYDDLIAQARSPLKILESLAMGTPVITSDVGDRRMLLANGTCGVLVNAGDAQALANGLIELLQNEKARKGMINAALAFHKIWYWDRLVTEFSKIYY